MSPTTRTNNRLDHAHRGFLHSTESGSGVDGPGMRFVFFLSGCQFRCQYCHNPDTWKLHNGRELSVDDALAEIGPYARFLKFAGGITISGGEPLLQAGFVGALAHAIKARYGLHIALDTQGFLHEHISDAWLENIDLVLLDIKHIDPQKYQAITSHPLQPTLDFAQRLVQLNKKMWIRYVLVPGLTDAQADIEKLAAFIRTLGPPVERVEVLPFHQFGRDKWAALGMDYPLVNSRTATAAETETARGLFAAAGLSVC